MGVVNSRSIAQQISPIHRFAFAMKNRRDSIVISALNYSGQAPGGER
jgi:hypothetical protein